MKARLDQQNPLVKTNAGSEVHTEAPKSPAAQLQTPDGAKSQLPQPASSSVRSSGRSALLQARAKLKSGGYKKRQKNLRFATVRPMTAKAVGAFKRLVSVMSRGALILQKLRKRALEKAKAALQKGKGALSSLAEAAEESLEGSLFEAVGTATEKESFP